jgi:DNA-binding response OmpR family regulator
MSIKLFLVDRDPIFCLGFSSAIVTFENLQVVDRFDNINATLTALQETVPDVLILDLNIDNSSEQNLNSWQFCQQLTAEYPDLPILLLSNTLDSQQLIEARALGIRGYCPKGTNIETIVSALERVNSGENYWYSDSFAKGERFLLDVERRRNRRWFSRMRESGMQQIEASLAEIQARLESPNLSNFDWLYWNGRKRELLASRWTIERLLPVELVIIQPQNSDRAIPPASDLKALPQSLNYPITIDSPQAISKIVLEQTLIKIKAGTENLTAIALETDILTSSKKKELLYIILERLNKILEELFYLEINSTDLIDRIDLILQQLWQDSTTIFTQRYYQKDINIGNILPGAIDISLYDVREYFLKKIIFSVDLFSYLLGKQPLKIENVEYRPEAPEAIARAEKLLQNLIIQIANAVMQVNLNNFSSLETSKYNLYKNNYRSSREIANFRNKLAWKYRKDIWLKEPIEIFESKYYLFYLNGKGIERDTLYSPRTEELARLRGIPWLVTIALEARDAIAPPLRSIINFLTGGLVYILTQVIGKGIGLIAKGIIQGIGNTIQETRYSKHRK